MDCLARGSGRVCVKKGVLDASSIKRQEKFIMRLSSRNKLRTAVLIGLALCLAGTTAPRAQQQAVAQIWPRVVVPAFEGNQQC